MALMVGDMISLGRERRFGGRRWQCRGVVAAWVDDMLDCGTALEWTGGRDGICRTVLRRRGQEEKKVEGRRWMSGCLMTAADIKPIAWPRTQAGPAGDL